jgi:hypothetical protein
MTQLTDQEKLAVRETQVTALSAHKALQAYVIEGNIRLKELEAKLADANGAFFTKLAEITVAHGLDPLTAKFNADTLQFD